MLSRRELFRRTAYAAMITPLVRAEVVVAEETKSRKENENTTKITQEFILATKKMGGVDVLGYRLNDAWKADDGLYYIAYEGVILQRDVQGRIAPWHSLDEMRDLDDQLDSGALGFQIPHYQELPGDNDSSVFDLRAKAFGLPQELLEFVEDMKNRGLNPGFPTSFGGDYGDFQVWRFNNMAFQRWKEDGRIERVMIGNLAFKIGMIPEEKKAITPDFNLEPEFAYQLEQERFSPSTRGIRAEGCEPTNTAWEGRASYYTKAGCMGCSINQIRADGTPYDENDYSTAFMRAPLGKKLLIVSKDTGVGVIVQVRDRGGFEPYGRIADMSLGTARALGVNLSKGVFDVTIILLNC